MSDTDAVDGLSAIGSAFGAVILRHVAQVPLGAHPTVLIAPLST